MKLFSCENCSHIIYFDNDACCSCNSTLGYIPETNNLAALVPVDDGWQVFGAPGRTYRFCSNAEWQACNWLVDTLSGEAACAACRYNRTVPDLNVDENLRRWRKVEQAKRHLFYSLSRFGLHAQTKQQDRRAGLAFDILTDSELPQGRKVMTGHDDALITLNLVEADDGAREKLREQLGEPYRTLLGHFRHEIGHFFWDRLVAEAGQLESFRAVFGDERADYDDALKAYYANGPQPGWRDTFVSGYATAHPWEDFAETWAHYLHMVDTLEMVHAYGIRVSPLLVEEKMTLDEIRFDPHDVDDVAELVRCWLPVTKAVNSINRCMGQPDLYPFVLPPATAPKFAYVHALIHGNLSSPEATAHTEMVAAA